MDIKLKEKYFMLLHESKTAYEENVSNKLNLKQNDDR